VSSAPVKRKKKQPVSLVSCPHSRLRREKKLTSNVDREDTARSHGGHRGDLQNESKAGEEVSSPSFLWSLSIGVDEEVYLQASYRCIHHRRACFRSLRGEGEDQRDWEGTTRREVSFQVVRLSQGKRSLHSRHRSSNSSPGVSSGVDLHSAPSKRGGVAEVRKPEICSRSDEDKKSVLKYLRRDVEDGEWRTNLRDERR